MTEEELYDGLKRSINAYHEANVNVKRGTADSQFYQYIVQTFSPTVRKRLFSKLQRRLKHGGIAQLQSLNPTMFAIRVSRKEINAV